MTATKKRTDIMLGCFLLVLLLGCACTRELDLERGNGKGLSFAVSTEPWQGGVFARTKSPVAEGIPVTLTDITDDAGNVSYMLETMEGVPVQPNHTLGRMGSAGTKGERKSEWANNEQFGLRAYVTGGGYDTDYDYFGQTRFAQLTDLHWRMVGEPVYWPKSESITRFYAWWPCSGGNPPIYVAANKALSYTVSGTPASQEDLLYAVSEPLNVIGNAGLVPLEFKHALTAVAVRCIGDMDIAIKKIKLTNVWCKGTFDMDSESWTVDQTDPEFRTDIVFDAYHKYSENDGGWMHSGDAGVNWILDSPQRDTALLSDGVGSEGLLMLLPQQMRDNDNTHQKQLFVILMNNDTLKIDLPVSQAWEAGNTVIYTLKKGGGLSNIDGSLTAHLGDNEDHTGVSMQKSYGRYPDYIRIDAWRYENQGDGTYVKVRSKWKATQMTGTQSGQTITLDGNAVSLSETYGMKGFVRPGQTYEQCASLWTGSGDTEEITTDASNPYRYYAYFGYAAPEPVSASRRSTKELLDSALQAKSTVGGVGNYYDLSGTHTANCYIVDAPGYYRFKAVRGNGEGNWVTPSADHIRIALTCIEDNPGHIIEPGSMVYTREEGFVPYIAFRTPTGSNFQQGNAIITARHGDEGPVLWQWHIWVTEPNYWHPSDTVQIHDNAANKYKFLPVSLGLCYTGYHQEFAQQSIKVKVVTTDDEGHELTGRFAASATLTINRDPLPIEEGYYYMGYRWGDPVPTSVIGYDGGEWRTPPAGRGRFPLPTFTNNSLVENLDRTSSFAYKTWNDAATSSISNPYSAVGSQVKAKWDPSPAGWHVPPAQATNYLTPSNHGHDTVHGYNSQLDGDGASIFNLYSFTQYQNGSSISTPIAFWFNNWYYWSSSLSVNSNEAYGSHKVSAESFFPEAYGIDNAGLVRPVKDQTP